MTQRTRVKHEKTFQQRLNDEALHLADEAADLPSGKQRKLLLKPVEQAEKASRIDASVAGAKMTDPSKPPIIMHATDALRRARKLPVGAARNDLRQLARALRDLHRMDAHAHLRSIECSESVR